MIIQCIFLSKHWVEACLCLHMQTLKYSGGCSVRKKSGNSRTTSHFAVLTQPCVLYVVGSHSLPLLPHRLQYVHWRPSGFLKTGIWGCALCFSPLGMLGLCINPDLFFLHFALWRERETGLSYWAVSSNAVCSPTWKQSLRGHKVVKYLFCWVTWT